MTNSIELVDSRRLTGPNRLWPRPGAVADLRVARGREKTVVRAWTKRAREILDAVGWHDEKTQPWIGHGEVSVALSAPMDALYAACEVNELAVELAIADLAETPATSDELKSKLASLRLEIEQESNPPLVALESAAADRNVDFLSDDDELSLGTGPGAKTWAVNNLPSPGDVDWSLHTQIPIARVTGTNGKSTTVRMLASIVEANGLCAGISSTDWIRVGNEVIDTGDYSGPGGARTVLRDPRVEIALLETARGGMRRRGLALPRADVAALLNVAADHLGEFGIHSVEHLAEIKWVVLTGARHWVLNAEDPTVRSLYERSNDRPSEVSWFALDREQLPTPGRDPGSHRFYLRGDALVEDRADSQALEIARVDEIPCTLQGAARHNVANALAAVAIARGLGLGAEPIRSGLAQFASSSQDNPGRLNLFQLGGVRALVDFAHNPHGIESMMATASAMPAERRLVVLGQAGDRDDESIREMAEIVWRHRPNRIVIKAMAGYERGRDVDAVPKIFARQFETMGASADAIESQPSELEAVVSALEWSRENDLLLLLSHSQRDAVLELLHRLESEGWQPGQPVE